MRFNKTVLASLVGAALAATATNAAAALENNNAQSYKASALKLAAVKQRLTQANVSTASGMINQFDEKSGKSTFQWAAKKPATPGLGAIATKHKFAYAADFYLSQLTGSSSKKVGNIQAVLTNVHDLGRGAKIAKYKQEVDGIEVFNREYNVMMDNDFNFVASSGYLTDQNVASQSLAGRKTTATQFGDPSKAIAAAYTAMGGDGNSVKLVAQSTKNKYQKFSVADASANLQIVGEPRSKKVFFEAKNKLVAAFYVELETSVVDSVDTEAYNFVVEAQSGKVLFKNNVKSHAEDFNYRYHGENDGKPWDSPHGNVIPASETADPNAYLTAPYLAAPMISLSHGPLSTNDAWLADDATTTQGNNVNAYADVVAPDGLTEGDFTAEVTADRTFDYGHDESQFEYSMHNRKAAIVNLFAINNYLHDDYYDHGFDEASGNAQNVNYGRGGVEGDALRVEVQDNSGTNNANMSTWADGRSPRMQMYMFNLSFFENGVDFGLTVDSDLALLSSGRPARHGPQKYDTFAGSLVRVEDATDPINDGCEEIVNVADLTGKIAVIDRGACNFTQKVVNAQAAGAIASIIVNNANGDESWQMPADDSVNITIPSWMISQNDGANVYAAMAAGDVNVNMFSNGATAVYKASSWDTGIVAHEWGHYISNRLVGDSSGLWTRQGSGLGEGWGDIHAMLQLSEADDVQVAGNAGFGGSYTVTSYVGAFTGWFGRRFPTTTNLEDNPLTFEDITLGNGPNGSREDPDIAGGAEEHDTGEVWAAAVWQAFVNLVNDDRHTFDEAKHLMKGYLVGGYKMTPITPTFTEARDAILAAAYAHDVDDFKVLLAGFAARGMGVGAVSPDRYSLGLEGVVESYNTEGSQFTVADSSLALDYDGATSGYCSKDSILDKGETATVSFSVQNKGSLILNDVVGVVEVVSDHNVTFANEGKVTFDSIDLFSTGTSAPVEFTLNEAGMGEQLMLKLSFPDIENSPEQLLTTHVNYDFKDLPFADGAQSSGLDDIAAIHDFKEDVMFGGEAATGTAVWNSWAPDPGGYLWLNNNNFQSDVAAQSRTMTVGYEGDFIIQWWHWYSLEPQWDGGVVEVSVNGSNWTDVTEFAGEGESIFGGDGYAELPIEENPASAISQRHAFTGNNSGWEQINFGSKLNGSEVKFRFRMVSDSNTVAVGWAIDTINFSNISSSIMTAAVDGNTYACDNRLPQLGGVDDQTVNEGATVTLSASATDKDADDTLTYSWVQTGGTTVTLTGGDTADASFTAPTQSSGSEELTFSVTVTDSKDSASTSMKVTVNDVPAPVVPVTPTPVSQSSGGSTGLIALLLLPLAFIRRRIK